MANVELMVSHTLKFNQRSAFAKRGIVYRPLTHFLCAARPSNYPRRSPLSPAFHASTQGYAVANHP